MVPDPPESSGIPDAPLPGPPSLPAGKPPSGLTQPNRGGTRPNTWFGTDSPLRRWLARWGFPLFIVVVVIVGREVLLPFIFAGLIAYILAPVVRWMTERKDGTRRMPRGLAILLCYIVLVGSIVGFGFLLFPRLATDLSRIGTEAPAFYKKVNDQWVPDLARYLEQRFPQLKAKPAPAAPEDPVPLPPGTAFTMTPLPDGRFAVALTPAGIDVEPQPNGGYRVLPSEGKPQPQTTEEKLRALVQQGVDRLKGQVDDLVRFTQRFITDVITGVFTFFLILMIAAFMLIDMEKVHAFLRSIFPPHVRDDYDVIIEGIDRGLSGVIRGQLLICLINGLLTYIGLFVFDVKYALLLGIVAALLSMIPIFGALLSTIPIVLAALVSGEQGLDFIRAIAMVLWIVGIHFIEANFLNPKIIGSSAKIHPVVVIFALIFGEREFGLIGALFAVPVASVIQVLFVFFYKKTWKKDPGTVTLATSGGG